MARPATKKVNLKKGFYIEIKRGSEPGIKIRRESFDEIKMAFRRYQNGFNVNYLGFYENSEFKKNDKQLKELEAAKIK